jgi:hypothetical protein
VAKTAICGSMASIGYGDPQEVFLGLVRSEIVARNGHEAGSVGTLKFISTYSTSFAIHYVFRRSAQHLSTSIIRLFE